MVLSSHREQVDVRNSTRLVCSCILLSDIRSIFAIQSTHRGGWADRCLDLLVAVATSLRAYWDALSVPHHRDIRRSATTHHSFLGSFSAVSKRNFATKYAFFQVFRDLQNYLADFLKKLQNFAKNRKILQNSCEVFRFLQKKSADFCENR